MGFLSNMFGSSTPQRAPTPAVSSSNDTSGEVMAALEGYTAMMSAIMAQQGEYMKMGLAQQQYSAPVIATPTEIDWSEKNASLAAKMKADYEVSNSAKKGRLDTVLTSPLLDDEETSTTSSVLGGGT